MRTVAIIQARVGATRLPSKVLLDLGGRPMLERVVRRASRAKSVDAVVVATTDLERDAPVAALAASLGVGVFRGSEDDVLDRYHGAAEASGADVVVRITADCPFVDPEVIDLVVGRFVAEHPDFAANTLERTFPHGLDVEVVSRSALDAAWREAKEPYLRAHVMPFVYQHPERFKLVNVACDGSFAEMRWTVDTPEDLELARAIYERFGGDDRFSWRQIVDLVRREPALGQINAHVKQKQLVEG
jgi:spore coat polysaccharide biosynthesis protein SpsF